MSHPFVERLIGTVRWDFLNHDLCSMSQDPWQQLSQFKDCYNKHRVHSSLVRAATARMIRKTKYRKADFASYTWLPHGLELFYTPVPA